MRVQIEEGHVYDITIVGTGATGSHLLPFVAQLLANKNIHRLRIMDGDVIEEKNLKNQKFMQADVGRVKAEVLATRYQSVYPELDIMYVDEFIKDKEALKSHIYTKEVHGKGKVIPILIGCVDNNSTRKLFDEVFMDEEIGNLIYIDSGNGTDDRVGQIVVGYKKARMGQVKHPTYGYNIFDHGVMGGDIILSPAGDIFPEIREEQTTVEQTLSCGASLNEFPQNIATNVMAAATLFTILNNILSFSFIPGNVSYFSAEDSTIISR